MTQNRINMTQNFGVAIISFSSLYKTFENLTILDLSLQSKIGLFSVALLSRTI